MELSYRFDLANTDEFQARAKRACRAKGEIQANDIPNERYKTVVQGRIAKGEKREEEEGERKWLGVQIGAGRSFFRKQLWPSFSFLRVFLFLFGFFTIVFYTMSFVFDSRNQVGENSLILQYLCQL